MNIFVLDPDPAICASMHCDQHLHKMILESAQMLSVLLHEEQPDYAQFLYAPTHKNHPCTQWVQLHSTHADWLYCLMTELDNVRQSLGHMRHQSMAIADIYRDLYEPLPSGTFAPTNFIFCGHTGIELRDCSVPEKYQAYYRFKQQSWKHTKNPMTYKGRTVPSFLTQE